MDAKALEAKERGEFDTAVARVQELVADVILANRDSLYSIFVRNHRSLTIKPSVKIEAKGAGRVFVKASFGCVLSRVDDELDEIIEFQQEPLPGMPEPTRTGRAASRGGGSISAAQAKAATRG